MDNNTTNLVVSIYTFLFNHDSRYYLYNSQANFFSEITKTLYDSLSSSDFQDLPSDVIDELVSRKILVSKDSVYGYYYGERMKFDIRRFNTRSISLVLAPTTACNFDCPYCFEPKNSPKTITTEIIDSLVEFVKSQQGCEYVSIIWYGGEPLMAFDKIKEIYSKLSAEGMPEIIDQSIITNGYCITDEVIDFFSENKCSSIQITIDGLEHKHNKTRRLLNSSAPTFGRIMENIDKVLTRLPETRVNIRVNINKNTYTDYVEVNNMFREKYPDNKQLSVYPGIILEINESKTSLCSECFKSTELMDLHQLLREKGIDTSDFPQRSYKGCTMNTLGSFVIGPSGEIYKCWNDVTRPETIIGYINQQELTNSELLVRCMSQSIPFSDECKDCYIFHICDGGCAKHRYRNLFENGKFELCSSYKDPENLKKALLTKTIQV